MKTREGQIIIKDNHVFYPDIICSDSCPFCRHYGKPTGRTLGIYINKYKTIIQGFPEYKCTNKNCYVTYNGLGLNGI